MEERLRFVARLFDGEKIAVLCREFGPLRSEDNAVPTGALQKISRSCGTSLTSALFVGRTCLSPSMNTKPPAGSLRPQRMHLFSIQCLT